MECNKEEAIRAKNFAETRMKSQDFEGAQKIALKARSLFPDLEGISQILTVCEVHCAAGTKIGGETDWYAVLQVEMMADDSTIRKQYRKFALQLHPDKNKLAGAETAFQLVGDAYKILSDPKKRSQYNVIRRTNFCSVSLNQAARQSYRPSGRKQPGPGVSSVAAKSTFVNFGGSNQNQPSPFLGVSTFWATCPSCNVGLQFYHNTLSKHVQCQKCFNVFAANELKTQGMSSAGSSAKAVSGAEFQKPKFNDSAFKQRSRPEYSSGSKNDVQDRKMNDFSAKINDEKIQNAQFQSIRSRQQEANTPASQTRRNEESKTQKLNDEKDSNLLRRSARNKRNASVESLSSASKRLKQGEKRANGVPNDTAFPGETEENGKRSISSELNNASAADSSSKASVDQENLTYPAPVFCNFESARSENKFAVGQVWAIYDNIDGMPRYYARVKKVYSREFKLQLTWLENDPKSITEMQWTQQGLPIVCGNFKHGKLYNTQERHIFSHLVQWRLGTKRNSYVIYPQRGEIWALFKNWNIGWSFKPDNHRTYEYQIVEVVSDFSEAAGISVVRLARIKEFLALFIRANDAEESLLEIPAKDVLIFSHRIPACRIIDKKEEGVPECAYELDCASLPRKFEAIFPSISLKGTKNVAPNVEFSQSTAAENGFKPIWQNAIEKSESGSKSSEFSKISGTSETMFVNSNGSQENASAVLQKLSESKNMKLRSDVSPEADNIGSSQKSENPEHPSLIAFEYPESEFYNFEDDRLMVKFECGQVWAFYCEIDNFPKYYGKIRRVDRENNRVNVRWLESYSALGANEGGAEDRPLLACGSFRATKETSTMDSGETFSHQANAKPTAEKNHFYIFPDVGEVWAVFRNRSATCSSSSSSDHQGYEFEVVEIISSRTASKIEALLLAKVDGHVSVFRRKKRGPDAVMLIPFSELSRFSHRIPAYRLEREMGGAGYWELDPAAVPAAFLS